jgi:hypothetical protein
MVHKIFLFLLPIVVPVLAVAYGLSVFSVEGQTLYYWPPAKIQEVTGEKTLGQTFIAALPDLYRIDVMLFDAGQRGNTRKVTFHLREGLDNPTDKFSVVFDASQVKGSQWYTFEFPALADSANKSYYFYFSSPEATEEGAIGVAGVQQDVYPGGLAYINTTPTSADLTFRTYYAGIGPIQKLSILPKRLTQNRPSLWGKNSWYVILGIAYLLVMTLLYRQLAQRVFK